MTVTQCVVEIVGAARYRRSHMRSLVGLTCLVAMMGCNDEAVPSDGAVIDAETDAAYAEALPPDGPGTIDAPDAAITLTCAQISEQLGNRAVAVGRQCSTRADCASVGAPVDATGSYTCGCGIMFASTCGGEPVNSAAWEADAAAQALYVEWRNRCVPAGCAPGVPHSFECGPGAIDCVDDLCTAAIHSCFADAGM
jgi:hypothetical protein